ncbi:hypothetical protein [Micromonospora sp. NPDC002717]|uniref:hypothetical protein n=1 Tax=Micromonospora sp. NPDC002717 TaxID=3154424 RepID=UPI00332E1091
MERRSARRRGRGDPAKRAFALDELQTLLDYADEQVTRIRATGRKGWLPAFRDAALFEGRRKPPPANRAARNAGALPGGPRVHTNYRIAGNDNPIIGVDKADKPAVHHNDCYVSKVSGGCEKTLVSFMPWLSAPDVAQ